MGVLKTVAIATLSSFVLGTSALACETTGSECVSWTSGAYDGHVDISHVMGVDGADTLSVTVVGSTEPAYDHVYLYDQTGKLVAALDGAINKTVVLKGPRFAARLLTDDYGSDKGVTVTACKCDGTNCPPAPAPSVPVTPTYTSGVDGEFAQPVNNQPSYRWDPEFH